MSTSGRPIIPITQDCACRPASLCTNAPQFPGAVGETGHGRRGPSPAVPLRHLKGIAVCFTVLYSEAGILGCFALVSLAAEWTTDGHDRGSHLHPRRGNRPRHQSYGTHRLHNSIYANSGVPGVGRIPPNAGLRPAKLFPGERAPATYRAGASKNTGRVRYDMRAATSYSSFRIPVSRANVTVNRHSPKVTRPAPFLPTKLLRFPFNSLPKRWTIRVLLAETSKVPGGGAA